MEHTVMINELTAALVKAQGALTAAKKTSLNPFHKSHYADLATVWELCRKPLADNGLAVIQGANIEGDRIVLETILTHVSGQWIKSYIPLNPAKLDSQGVGSAITYARRYALCAMVGITAEDEDDDGEAAMDRKINNKPAKPEPDKAEPVKPPPTPTAPPKGTPPDPAKEIVRLKAQLREVLKANGLEGKSAADWVGQQSLEKYNEAPGNLTAEQWLGLVMESRKQFEPPQEAGDK